MNQNWIFPSSNNITRISLYDNANPAAYDTNLKFEFDNTSYGTNGSVTALIGTGGTNNVSNIASGNVGDIHTDSFVSTVTYHDGDDNLNFANSGGTNPIGDAILSGLNGSGDFTGGSHGNQLTIHSNAGNDGEYVFSGNIYVDGSTATDLTILKTGTGEQTLSGNVNIADGDTTESGYLNVARERSLLNQVQVKRKK